jgi:hypothetical protein
MLKKEIARKRNIIAAAATRGSRSAGPAHAVFRSVIDAWMRISGDLPAAVLTGSALIAGA